MGTFAEISRYLVQTAFGVLLFAVLVRLLLQLARADFYNPISQFIVKVTSPLLRPLRRIIPPLGRLDSASLVLALAIQCIATLVVLALLGFSIGNPLLLLAWSLLGILSHVSLALGQITVALVTGAWNEFIDWVRDALVSDVRLPL